MTRGQLPEGKVARPDGGGAAAAAPPTKDWFTSTPVPLYDTDRQRLLNQFPPHSAKIS